MKATNTFDVKVNLRIYPGYIEAENMVQTMFEKVLW
jgi:hypothetical protein